MANPEQQGLKLLRKGRIADARIAP